MTKRAKWRRKAYRWRIDRTATRDQIYRNMQIKSIKRICLQTLTLYPWAMSRLDGFPATEERFRRAKKRMADQRKRRLLADGVTKR